MTRPDHTQLAFTRATKLRNQLTISEARVWSAIKAERAGARFRRQVPIGHWIADFAFLNPKLVLEIDDPSHEWRDDTSRTEYFESQGFSILRFTNKRVATEFEGVFNTIETWVSSLRESNTLLTDTSAPSEHLRQQTPSVPSGHLPQTHFARGGGNGLFLPPGSGATRGASRRTYQ